MDPILYACFVAVSLAHQVNFTFAPLLMWRDHVREANLIKRLSSSSSS